MENRQQQILSEIKEMMSSIRMQLELLDTKMAELQYEVDPQDFNVEPIDLGLDEVPVEIDDDLPFFDEPVIHSVQPQVEKQEEEPVLQIVEQPVEEVVETPLMVNDAVHAAGPKQVVLDAMTARQAWRTDMPGAPVRDIRSAISLNDRVLFINRLFDEDPVAFQDALTALNQMDSLEDAVNYLVASHPSWDLDSELVYRFMMALRRKIN